VTPDLGAIVLTTGGYALLLSPFPVIASSPFGASSGPGFVTPPVMTGSLGSPGVPRVIEKPVLELQRQVACVDFD
jgi:hypothetical protein